MFSDWQTRFVTNTDTQPCLSSANKAIVSLHERENNPSYFSYYTVRKRKVTTTLAARDQTKKKKNTKSAKRPAVYPELLAK